MSKELQNNSVSHRPIVIYQMIGGGWCVEDNSSALRQEFKTGSKGGVLSKVAEILDAMDPFHPTLNEDEDNREVTVLVTMQASICDPKGSIVMLDVRKGAEQAVQYAVEYGEGEGHVHPFAEDISLGLVSVEALTAE